ncbi:MAG: hypothetical protein EBV23_03795 [Flavobacteriia bacterium]|nr:hypothetical protein [Flavobacteriia bacterium]
MISYEGLDKQELIELLDARDIEIEILSASVARLLKENIKLKEDIDSGKYQIIFKMDEGKAVLKNEW